MFNFIRFKAIFTKEFKHIVRDRFTLLLSLLLPLLIVLILGNSIEFNLKKISTVVIDMDKTPSSRQLLETFTSSGYFRTYGEVSAEKGMKEIIGERARICLFIPKNFEKETLQARPINSQILLDGADNSSVSAVSNYLSTISEMAKSKLQMNNLDNKPIVNFKVRYLFNPELNSKWFALPGLSAVIIALVAILLTSLTICREWELGSMELLLSTPARSSEIIIGKILPYAFLGLSGFLIVYLAARLIFDVPFIGSHFLLLLGTLLFIFDYLAIGLYISVITKQQQVAIQYALIVGMLPTSMLSGFIFPVEYMPQIFMWVSSIFPAKWYVEVCRDQFLKGSTFFDLIVPFSVMTLQGIIITSGAILKFKRNLE